MASGPNARPASAAKNVQLHVSRLRKAPGLRTLWGEHRHPRPRLRAPAVGGGGRRAAVRAARRGVGKEAEQGIADGAARRRSSSGTERRSPMSLRSRSPDRDPAARGASFASAGAVGRRRARGGTRQGDRPPRGAARRASAQRGLLRPADARPLSGATPIRGAEGQSPGPGDAERGRSGSSPGRSCAGCRSRSSPRTPPSTRQLRRRNCHPSSRAARRCSPDASESWAGCASAGRGVRGAGARLAVVWDRCGSGRRGSWPSSLRGVPRAGRASWAGARGRPRRSLTPSPRGGGPATDAARLRRRR